MENAAVANLIVDDREAGLFRVKRQVFTDPEIMAMEQRRVFEQSWIYAGHESEIRQAGDFVSREVVGRPVILVRGADGVARVLLNTCTHRGALVCLEKRGNCKTFQCYYHAWTYNNQGELLGIPGEERYSPAFDRKAMGLATPPRTEIYRGFIFISFNPDIEGLVTYLAGARDYLDLVCDQSEVGMEVVGGTQAYSMRANWKLLVENSMDGYHAPTTHRRYFDYLMDTGGDPQALAARHTGRAGIGLALGNGHAAIQSEPVWGRPIARWAPQFPESKRAELEVLRQRFEQRFGPERAYKITQTSRNLLIFPNLMINDIMAITIRTFYPVAPDNLAINAWALAPQDESADNRALRLDSFLTFLGPGGYATPDDVEALESCQRGFANREVVWSDISKGMHREEALVNDELQMRAFWRKWHALMMQTLA